VFDCGNGDIYSVTIQKGEDDHEVMKLIVDDLHHQQSLDDSNCLGFTAAVTYETQG
jgi:hypothetical protein